MTNCRRCNALIIFNGKVRSEAGNIVPLNPDGSRHFCSVEDAIEHEEKIILQMREYVSRRTTYLRHFQVHLMVESLPSQKKL